MRDGIEQGKESMTKRFQVERCFRLLLLAVIFTITDAVTIAQSSVFTYQGHLTDSANPATGVFDMQFKLFERSKL